MPSPEMPGDRFARLVNWQTASAGRFAGHRFTLERNHLSALEAIAAIFDDAPKGPWALAFRRSDPLEVPAPAFAEELTSLSLPKDVSISFGLNRNNYPEYSVAEMIAHLCLDHGIALLECSKKRYRFGVAPPREPQVHEAIERGKQAGLQLQVHWPPDPGMRYRVTITNHGDSAVTLGYPGDGSSKNGRPPFVVWSVFPIDQPESLHPSPRCRDRFVPGCGNMNGLTSDDIREIQPGETLDVGGWIGRLWEFESGEAKGEYRARLYYRNNPNHPMSHWDLLHADISKQAAVEMRKTLDCLLISNEITFTAINWKEEWRRRWEEWKKTRKER